MPAIRLQSVPVDRPSTGRATGHRALTLVETVLALTLMIMMFSGVYSFYFTALKARETGGAVARDVMLARGLLERMAVEIRAATDVVPGDGIGFQGRHDRITVITPRIPEPYAYQVFGIHDQLPPAQLDYVRVSYQLVWDDELEDDEGVKICHGLWRSVQKTFDPNPWMVVKTKEGEAPGSEEDQPGQAAMPIEGELIAPEIKYLRFEFFDGTKWQDRWHTPREVAEGSGLFETEIEKKQGGKDRSLPQAVRITVGRERVPPEDEEFNITQLKKTEERRRREEFHPDRFTLVVALKQADPTLISSREHGANNDREDEMGGGQ